MSGTSPPVAEQSPSVGGDRVNLRCRNRQYRYVSGEGSFGHADSQNAAHPTSVGTPHREQQVASELGIQQGRKLARMRTATKIPQPSRNPMGRSSSLGLLGLSRPSTRCFPLLQLPLPCTIRGFMVSGKVPPSGDRGWVIRCQRHKKF